MGETMLLVSSSMHDDVRWLRKDTVDVGERTARSCGKTSGAAH